MKGTCDYCLHNGIVLSDLKEQNVPERTRTMYIGVEGKPRVLWCKYADTCEYHNHPDVKVYGKLMEVNGIRILQKF